MPEFFHRAFGLVFKSALYLPEMSPVSAPDQFDVSVSLGAIPQGASDHMTPVTPFVLRGENSWLISIPEVGRYLVEGPSSITIEPVDGTDENSLRVFLLGSSIGMILMARGFLVLHAAAIQVGENCFLATGLSGAGKSTLAAGFHLRGHAVCSDDLVALTPSGEVLPALNRLKLWQDTAQALGIDTTQLRRIRPDLEKFALPVVTPDKPLPVRHVFDLLPEARDDFVWDTLTGIQKFDTLRAHIYRRRYLTGDPSHDRQMQLCLSLAKQAEMSRVRRPRDTFALDELLDDILDRMKGHA